MAEKKSGADPGDDSTAGKNADNGSADESRDKSAGKPVFRDKRRVDPETGDIRAPKGGSSASATGASKSDGATGASDGSGPDGSGPDGSGSNGSGLDDSGLDDSGLDDSGLDDSGISYLAGGLSADDQALLDGASRDLVGEMRSEVKRSEAELYNFRQRVERDRTANREAVIAEVIRSLLPALDDLARAEAHGDLVEGAPLTLVAQKLRSSFERFGLQQVGEKGDTFDPAFHEAVVQLPSKGVTVITIADVLEPGYTLGERLVRPAKVVVSMPAD